ncbi:MAG: DNA cytosine methyltransferase [Candidatus Helarchaeota archaeon]
MTKSQMTKTTKVLNLYAGIGGNRKLWTNVDVTAVEINPGIAKIYQDFFPDDKIVVTDAHQYLLEHFEEYEFIWSSCPCFSHSRAKFWANKEKVYPDMALYEEILFLKYHFKNFWVIENVLPYYKPLIPAQQIGRHLFWSNFWIRPMKCPNFTKVKDSVVKLQKYHGIDISSYKISRRKVMILRNCVYPPLGLHIFNQSKRVRQLSLFTKEKQNYECQE